MSRLRTWGYLYAETKYSWRIYRPKRLRWLCYAVLDILKSPEVFGRLAVSHLAAELATVKNQDVTCSGLDAT